ncbi:succinate-semialdehyde dehydrogenase/glutarate-semialdehyde dehydrogenase [Haloactinospora alba]|uniref:Succinate-semialdehyde dehydrogenase/glutarate-semialdehyde dehydrogenase n=1 Tax=Haloactinospora alba TaxID=405555 RepID=A0A543N923_9ACTN|nr:NAD-dependent succinate-semialdehyde dehydrogenase [Haloactinospora alba]TQN28322.1 succinate-semialdehyde dehydrogenase/glutarate-semialdehyde dehydrogenase [Haloactinospora alba]
MITAGDETRVVERVAKQLFVGGQWRDAASRATFAVEDPSTTETLCEIADAATGDAFAALDVAARTQGEWASTAPRERAEILRRAYELLMERRDDLALLMTLEMGKPVPDAKGEVAYAADFLRWFSEEAVRIEGGFSLAPSGQARFLIMRQPVGPAMLITPWNFPMAMGTRKIGPAIAAGCTMVLKPAQQTPLSALALAGILREAGLPDGVLSVLPTSDAGGVTEPLLRDGRIRKVSFTGSTGVGRALLEQSAPQVLRTSMELGGNAPFLVFDDADLDAAVEGAVQAKMRNIGEACTAANRFYVQSGVAAEFARRLGERMGEMVVARGTEEASQVGPLIDADARRKVQHLVDDAVQRGARVLVGGNPSGGPGYFYQPTVLTDVPQESELSSTEIFGPVAPIIPFGAESEALAASNDTEYGLVSYVYTTDLSRAFRVCEALETGMVGLNQGVVSNPAAPFGGVKHSGIGREGGRVGIDEYLETKYVGIGGV